MRGIVLLVGVALMACSGGDAGDRHARSAALSAPAPDQRPAVPASLAGAAVISSGNLATEPESEKSQARESTAPDPELRAADTAPLPPAMAEALGVGPVGLSFDPAHDLAIALTPDTGEELSLLLGGTSVMDADSRVPEFGEPTPEVGQAAAAESLR